METCFHFVIILKLISITYVLWLAWKLSFVYLSFYRELDYAPSYLAGLSVHPLNPKAWLMVIASFWSFGNDQMTLLYQELFKAALFIIQYVFHSIWFAAESKIAMLISSKKEEKIFIFFEHYSHF